MPAGYCTVKEAGSAFIPPHTTRNEPDPVQDFMQHFYSQGPLDVLLRAMGQSCKDAVDDPDPCQASVGKAMKLGMLTQIKPFIMTILVNDNTETSKGRPEKKTSRGNPPSCHRLRQRLPFSTYRSAGRTRGTAAETTYRLVR